MVRKKAPPFIAVIWATNWTAIWTALLITGVLPTSFAEAASNDSTITFVGVDNDNTPIETTLPSRKYQENLKTAIASINDSTLVALNTQQTRKAWSLRAVSVGVGANLELGIGSLIKVAVLPRFRLLFANTNEPAVP